MGALSGRTLDVPHSFESVLVAVRDSIVRLDQRLQEFEIGAPTGADLYGTPDTVYHKDANEEQLERDLTKNRNDAMAFATFLREHDYSAPNAAPHFLIRILANLFRVDGKRKHGWKILDEQYDEIDKQSIFAISADGAPMVIGVKEPAEGNSEVRVSCAGDAASDDFIREFSDQVSWRK